MRHTVGVDLGMGAEPTALAVLERRQVEPNDHPDDRQPAYALRHLHRFAPGTSYPAISEQLLALLRTPPLPGAWVLIDYTGAGRVVLRLVLRGLVNRVAGHYSAVCLAPAGHEIGSSPGGGFLIPKPELIGTVQVLLQTRRLQIPRDLSHAPLLIRELENYRPKVVLSATEPITWRDGQHDDLILATALAAWGGEKALAAECEQTRKVIYR